MNKLSPVQQKFILHWGEMGTRWGINRTVAQVHALLYLSPRPLHGKGDKIKTGYVFAIEPMVNIGSHFTKVLADGWTVVTVDGKPSAHAEHTIAITEEGPEVLTLVKSGFESQAV
jgi:methionine aminopeptidase